MTEAVTEAMTDAGQVLLKILGLSGAITLLIKYVVPYLNLPATAGVALTLVVLPPILLGIALVWRNQSALPPPDPLEQSMPDQPDD